MDSLLAVLGLLFLSFLVLSTAVEVVLEVFRGILERFGLTWVRGKMTLDEALDLTREFAANDDVAGQKLRALALAASQLGEAAQGRIRKLGDITEHLKKVSPEATATIVGALHGAVGDVKVELQRSERQRIFALRLIAALLGCLIAYRAEFHVFRIIAQSQEGGALLANLPGLQDPWINVIVGGLAAAAGSSYWHDQLDKIRNAKAALQGMRDLSGRSSVSPGAAQAPTAVT